jgi:GT2 family glycosyltransferase
MPVQPVEGMLIGAADYWKRGESYFPMVCFRASVSRTSRPTPALYNFVRAVDYCSASFFATQRDLFLELNGFDRAFPSLDYAAADYAFRARDKGRHIYYQPESAVVTILDEHAPGGNSSELDSNQRASRQLFIKRWAHKLREQPVAPASGSPVWQDLAIRQ